jgi:hypothetical protein
LEARVPTLDEITPPSPPMPRWATWVAYRRPEHKQHPSLGQAKGALSYTYRETITPHGFTGPCALFEFVDGHWVMRAQFHRGDSKDHILWTNVRLFEAGMTGIINEAEIPGDR